MKKVFSLILSALAVLGLSSCALLTEPRDSAAKLNNEVYTSCTDDFSEIENPLGQCYSYYEFTPTRNSLYYFHYDYLGRKTLYRATKDGTRTIANEDMGQPFSLCLDGFLQGVGDCVYYSGYKDSLVKTTGFLFKYDPRTDSTEEVLKNDIDFGKWIISENTFVYSPYEPATISDSNDPSIYPYETYSLLSYDLSTGFEKTVADKEVLYFDVLGDRIYYVTYNDGFYVFSCDLDGDDTILVGQPRFDFDPKIDYICDVYVTEGYAVFECELGDDMTQTDMVVFSLEDGTTKVYSYEMYAHSFDVVGNYAFASMVINYDDISEENIPLSDEGIYRIDLSDGTEELICNAFAYNDGIFGFDENCIYTVMTRGHGEVFTTEIFRVRVDETPVAVYKYEQ